MPHADPQGPLPEHDPPLAANGPIERVATVRLVGEIDSSTADSAAAQLRAPLTNGPDVIDIDMSGVTYLNAAGGHAFVSLIGAALPAGVRLLIRDASPLVRSALSTLGLDRFFTYVVRAD
ncbi:MULTISPECIES: STAS domain-containing protein [unclassified Streptomyces]|uniref:STAS domain-containing protein n=1 Tax=unclassified Streptomyces TaxID=2593676 RepID=UPI0015E17D07|nr:MULTISPECIES: STAS domain-containing protein [unclassified Streptomyces]